MFIGVYWFHVASWEKVFEMANYRGNSYKNSVQPSQLHAISIFIKLFTIT